MTWEYFIAKPVLLAHCLLGLSALAASVHLALACWWGRGEEGGRFRWRSGLHAKIVWWLLLATVITGGIVYPAFRVAVREEFLDAHHPALTGLFEIKEHWGSIGLALALGLFLQLRRERYGVTAPISSARWGGCTALSTLLIIVCALCSVAGLILVMVRSV